MSDAELEVKLTQFSKALDPAITAATKECRLLLALHKAHMEAMQDD